MHSLQTDYKEVWSGRRGGGGVEGGGNPYNPQLTHRLSTGLSPAMFRWLTRRKAPDPAPAPEPPRLAARVVRLETEVEDLHTLVEQLQGAQRKLTGAVYGMKGADKRHPQRVGGEETLDEFRERMMRAGQLRARPLEGEGA